MSLAEKCSRGKSPTRLMESMAEEPKARMKESSFTGGLMPNTHFSYEITLQ